MKEVIQAAAQVLMDTVLELLQNDPHSWSTRPCQTCRSISSIIGRPFGCYKYTEDRSNANTSNT